MWQGRGRGCGSHEPGPLVSESAMRRTPGTTVEAVAAQGFLWGNTRISLQSKRSWLPCASASRSGGAARRRAMVWEGRSCLMCHANLHATFLVSRKMFQSLWMWREEYQHHEQLPLAFNGTWPSWNSDLDNRPW